MAKQELTCDDILKELRAKQYRPIYYLMGEESYYIDLIADYITDNVLTDTEKEFNLTVVYGADVDVATVINAAKRYPMMSEHQVVIVKEAQAIRNIEELSYYLQKPLNSTILVVCHKHGTLDRRKKLAAEIEKTGILFESKKIKEAQLPAFISSYMKRKGIDMEPKATAMLADFVGTDLSRLTGELEKLIITFQEVHDSQVHHFDKDAMPIQPHNCLHVLHYQSPLPLPLLTDCEKLPELHLPHQAPPSYD